MSLAKAICIARGLMLMRATLTDRLLAIRRDVDGVLFGTSFGFPQPLRGYFVDGPWLDEAKAAIKPSISVGSRRAR